MHIFQLIQGEPFEICLSVTKSFVCSYSYCAGEGGSGLPRGSQHRTLPALTRFSRQEVFRKRNVCP